MTSVNTLSPLHLKIFTLTESKSSSEMPETENWGALSMRRGYVGRLVSSATSSFDIFVLTEPKSSSENSESDI